ncbi:VOC family protein [Tenacibaculum sp. 190524A02b]|uniref:VOC domain-containing protein YaeR n=1 Tax=Tenacibaculum vairaonense TaxID=3137860 RepID=A0ABM9PKD3_9FLAO
MLNRIHHTAIICSNYTISKHFYTEILGLEIIKEHYRVDRDSYKLDLGLNGNYIIELFSFPDPPKRLSFPESCGLRHLAFEVDNIETIIDKLKSENLSIQPIRIDEYTGKKFTFFFDPDDLPIELYEK